MEADDRISETFFWIETDDSSPNDGQEMLNQRRGLFPQTIDEIPRRRFDPTGSWPPAGRLSQVHLATVGQCHTAYMHGALALERVSLFFGAFRREKAVLFRRDLVWRFWKVISF